MKNINLIMLALIIACASNLLLKSNAEESESSFEDLLNSTTKSIFEKKEEKKEIVESGQIKFKVKKQNLWFKDKLGKTEKLSDFIELSLPGKLYNPPRGIQTIERKEDVDRSTLENAISSIFSANKSGNLNWIVENFVDSDQGKIKKIFQNKKLLEESKLDAERIISIYITGQVDYKDSTIVLIEQKYIDGRKAKESMACKKTEKGWKVTNEFSADKNFDIVFAALSYGEITMKDKKLPENEKPSKIQEKS